MKKAIGTAGAVLAVCLISTAASAATVTAIFAPGETQIGSRNVNNVTSFSSGEFAGTNGTDHGLIITGEDDVTGTSGAMFPSTFATGTGSVASYSITSLTYLLPDLGRTYTSTSVTGYIGDNVIGPDENGNGGKLVDGIFIRGTFMDGAISGVIEYIASFEPDTLASTDLSEAISAGLIAAETVFERAGVALFPDQGPSSGIGGRISITEVLIDPDGGGGSGGGDGGSGGGDGGTPDLTPVPLPASGLLLLAGVAGLGALRRKRVL